MTKEISEFIWKLFFKLENTSDKKTYFKKIFDTT